MSEDDADIDRLLREAGARKTPPDAMLTRTYDALAEEWQAVVRRRRNRRIRVFGGAMAATVVLALGGAWLASGGRELRAFQVELAAGEAVRVNGAPVAPGALELAASARLEAAQSARLIARGVDVRVRGGTELEWVSADAVFLRSGEVYVDTGGGARFVVYTPRGVVRDIGTRYLVQFVPAGFAVRVRDGTAEVETDTGRYLAAATAGEASVARIAANGTVEIGTEPASAPAWDWVHNVSPGYHDRTVGRLLEAIVDDLGKRLEYASPGVETIVMTMTIEGDLTGLPPDEALRVVAGAAGLAIEESTDRVIVGLER